MRECRSLPKCCLKISRLPDSCELTSGNMMEIVTGASGGIGNLSLPPKREPASLHRWYNKILLMHLSGAHGGVRSVNDNE
jgi:hypothetical protein